MPRYIVAFLVLTLSFSLNGLAMQAEKRYAELFNNSDYQTLLDDLRALEKSEPSSFVANNFDYLYARAAEKNGNFSLAVTYYQKVAARDGDLGVYALRHLSRLMRETGNLAAERLFLLEMAYGTSAAMPARLAHQRLVRNYFESGDYTAVISSLEHGLPVVGPAGTTGGDRELQLLLGKAFRLDGQAERAVVVFLGLIESAPDKNRPDDFSLEAVKGLDRIETGTARIESVKNLTAREHRERADIYQHNRDFGHARLHYKAIVENHKGNSMIPAAMYQIGRGFVQERKYEEAAPWFEGIKDEDAGAHLKGPALYAAAGVYANLDKHSEAIAAYEKFIIENPDASNIERGYLNIIDAYRDAGDFKKALEWCSKTAEAFRGQKGEGAGLFAEVRIHVAAGDWLRALASLNRLKELKDLGGMGIAGGTNREEVAFLRGLMQEKLGRRNEAIDAYLSISDGRSEYYGWRANERLKGLKATGIELPAGAIQPGPEKLSKGKALDSNVPKLMQKQLRGLANLTQGLLTLGLYDEAAPEIETDLRKSQGLEGDSLSDFDDDTAFTLATYYSKGGYADRSIRFIEPKWKKVDRFFPIDSIPNEQLLLLYPAPYRDALIKYGEQNKVDPRFLLSIMRQESRFQADIKSAAAARGLMQFITNTSNKMALEMDLEHFRQDELYDPDTAIRFGSHYISKIFKDFPGQPQAVAASYNGGEDRMARWLKRAQANDPDQYVPEIIFAQTKDYVYRVMSNYRMYQHLYEKNLKPRTQNPRTQE